MFEAFGAYTDKKIHMSAIPTPIGLKFGCETSEGYGY